MTTTTARDAIDAVLAELLAADVVYQLARIAKAQHRIAVAVRGEHRAAVLEHLRGFAIGEDAAEKTAVGPLNHVALALLSDDATELRRALQRKLSAMRAEDPAKRKEGTP